MISNNAGDAAKNSENSLSNAACAAVPSASARACAAASSIDNGPSGPAKPLPRRTLSPLSPIFSPVAFSDEDVLLFLDDFIPGIAKISLRSAAKLALSVRTRINSLGFVFLFARLARAETSNESASATPFKGVASLSTETASRGI